MTGTWCWPLASVALALLGALVPAGVALGAPSISVVGQVGGGQYVPGTWVPLRIMLSNDTDRPIDGLVEADGLPGIDGEFRVQANVVVPARSRYRTTVYVPLAAPSERRPDAQAAASNVGIFRWTQAGAQLAQTDLLLRTANPDDADAAPTARSTIVAFGGSNEREEASYDLYALPKPLGEVLGTTAVPLWILSPENAPVHPAAYESCRAILLAGEVPGALSVPQRQAILSFVRAGGTLAVLAPSGVADVRGTWLEPLLPVQVVGHRLTSQIRVTDGTRQLREPVEIAEAVRATTGDVTVLLGDAHYVHAAYRPLGLGRVAFLSVPVNALTFPGPEAEEAMQAFWSDLLGLTRPDPAWAGTLMPAQRKNVLQEMIGTPAPARGTAVALAGGFALLVMACQLVWRGPRRPIAFAASALAAVVGAGALGSIGWLSQRSVPLTAGRVSVLTLAPGGGLVQEMAAFTGDVPTVSLATGVPGAALQPVAYDASTPPSLAVDRFAAPDAGVAANRIDRLWEAQATAPYDLRATASGTFDETGLRLSVDSGLPTSLVAPVLVHGGSVYRLPAPLPPGATQVAIDPRARNVPTAAVPAAGGPGGAAGAAAANDAAAAAMAQRYLNAGTILTDVDKLRARVLSSVLTRSRSTAAVGRAATPRTLVAGWIESAEVATLIRLSAQPQVEQALRLVTVPLQIMPSPVGSTVTIDAGFNTPVPGPVAVPIYDQATDTWLPSSQPGQWQIGFRPPPQVGPMALTRATLRLNVSLPVQSLVLRRGQVRDGRVDENLMMSGPEIVRLGPTFGAQVPVTVDLTPTDFDATGTFWVALSVEAPLDGGGVVPLWSVTELGADLTGRVVEPQQPPPASDGG